LLFITSNSLIDALWRLIGGYGDVAARSAYVVARRVVLVDALLVSNVPRVYNLLSRRAGIDVIPRVAKAG
jgi:hypothetical protein